MKKLETDNVRKLLESTLKEGEKPDIKKETLGFLDSFK